jgi:hypothetical protein
MQSGRGLSQSFIDALKSDSGLGLSRLLLAVKMDETLCLEIRKNYINIYYRGGNLIKLEEDHGIYSASFDRNYIIEGETTCLWEQINKQNLTNYDDVTVWLDAIPFMKQEMDYWLHIHPKDEREFQQLMVRENNFGGTAKGTDYFICDIEYSDIQGRFDLIAAEWPSSGAQRKNNRNVSLAFIEMKYRDKSMTGSSGILGHLQGMKEYYLKNNHDFTALKQEMRTTFNQKLELGLIDNQNHIECFNDTPPSFILIFANHDPDSEILIRELREIVGVATELPFECKFAASNFMGYGLYKENIFGLEEFLSRFSKQIYSRKHE